MKIKVYDKNNKEIKINNFVNSQIGVIDSENNKIIEYGKKCEAFKGDE